jgi:hypothetical protein
MIAVLRPPWHRREGQASFVAQPPGPFQVDVVAVAGGQRGLRLGPGGRVGEVVLEAARRDDLQDAACAVP